ncbi:MAG TPA: response regulator transcription factor [Thermoanaerobaculia bacterium]|nr:response regulator transcription factor [Thermoanaerobaculia bacterium]
MKLLVVEDSERLRRSLGQGLQRAGFAVDLTADGREGLAYAAFNDYDVIILDLMLPEVDGLTVLKTLRRQGKSTHVLILSAKDQVEDRIRGLELGADDYLIKPFSFDELCARVRALIRRRYESKDPVLRVGGLEIDTARQLASRDGKPLPLTPAEYALLEMLVMRRGRVVTREQILDHLYDSASEVASNVIEVLVCSLRKKVQPEGAPPVIVTRRGRGYLIEALIETDRQ